jgi:hypothetical protein
LQRFEPKPDEEILSVKLHFDEAAEELKKIYGDRVRRISVVGEAQRLVELAYWMRFAIW